jgi:hypothetical protein
LIMLTGAGFATRPLSNFFWITVLSLQGAWVVGQVRNLSRAASTSTGSHRDVLSPKRNGRGSRPDWTARWRADRDKLKRSRISREVRNLDMGLDRAWTRGTLYLGKCRLCTGQTHINQNINSCQISAQITQNGPHGPFSQGAPPPGPGLPHHLGSGDRMSSWETPLPPPPAMRGRRPRLA